jgi:hypothetical protein
MGMSIKFIYKLPLGTVLTQFELSEEHTLCLSDCWVPHISLERIHSSNQRFPCALKIVCLFIKIYVKEQWKL